MRFTLVYDGALPSRGNAADKHRIRMAVEPQLRELWRHEPLLNYPEYLSRNRSDEIPVLEELGEHTFAPLVTKALWLQAELDILMLRPERPGGIVTSGGDLDNRLKTLFDGLRVPATAQEISTDTRVECQLSHIHPASGRRVAHAGQS